MNFDQSILTKKLRYLMSTHLPMVAVHAALLLTFVIAATMATVDAGKAHRNVVSESPWPWSVPIGLGISQTALLGTFASLAHASFFYRIRWTFRLLALQWICFSVPLLAVVKQRPLPWCLLISELSVLLGAFLVGLMVRLVIHNRLTFEGKDSIKIRNVSSLMDLFVLMTIIAVFLGVTIRYNEDLPTGSLTGIGYVVMIYLSVYYGLPFSAILAVMAIGYGARDPKFAWYWGWTWLAAATGVFAVYSLVLSQSYALWFEDKLNWSIIFVSAIASNVVSAMYFRYRGTRLRRLTHLPLPTAQLPEGKKL
jgi:hypothetical protein